MDLKDVWKYLDDFAQQFAVQILVSATIAAITSVAGWIRTYWLAKRRIEKAEHRVTRVIADGREREGSGLWISKPIIRPDNLESRVRGSGIPIMVFGNLKGGVGKTTLAAQLAAHYAMTKNERVLAIDADYQGSLSSMLFKSTSRVDPGADSAATLAFGGLCSRDEFERLARPVDQVGMIQELKLRGIPAYYDLAQAENRLLVEWAIQAESSKGVHRVGSRDIRYMLFELLHDQAVQGKFDRIIIDAPPRLTAACIQAFCAATHLIIPTVLDTLSGEAVSAFVDQIKVLRENKVCPGLKIAGVVPYAPGSAQRYRREARANIEASLKRSGTEAELLGTDFEIPSLPFISEVAGTSIAYAADANNPAVRRVRDVFSKIADELENRDPTLVGRRQLRPYSP